MTLLSQIHVGKKPAKRRTMLYGVQGIGKSTWAASAERPVFVPTEDGLGGIDCASFPLATSLQQVLDALGELHDHPHDFATVVIDSLDWLEQLVFAKVCEEHNAKSIEDIPYARGYTFALTHWRGLLTGLDMLRYRRGMAVILLAHSKVERFENPETSAYDRYVPRLQKLAAATMMEWCDEVLFATYKVFTTSEDLGFKRKRSQGHNATGERVVRTSERPAHMAKNRLGMPQEIPMAWAAYQGYVAAALGIPAPDNTNPSPTQAASDVAA